MAKAPQSAIRVVEFLNSRGVGYSTGQDQLSNASEALGVLRLFDKKTKTIDESLLAATRSLRSVLLDMQRASNDSKAYSRLDRFSSDVSFRPVFGGITHAEWVQTAGNPIIGAILKDVFELVTSGLWARIKTCADDACAATFFDETRSGTQRWHSYATCGNRSNVAAFRSRQTE